MKKCILSILVLIVISCATFNDQKRLDSLEVLTDRYENAIRWGFYELAGGLVKTSEGPANTAPDYERLKKIRVSSYKVLNRGAEKGELKAVQVVEIRYYHIDYMIEKVLTDTQLWEYDTSEEKWYLTSGLPAFAY